MLNLDLKQNKNQYIKQNVSKRHESIYFINHVLFVPLTQHFSTLKNKGIKIYNVVF